MRRALLLGSTGQLGTELLRASAPADWTLVVGPMELFDFTRPEEVERNALADRPDCIINAAAYTAVDKAESEPEIADSVNATTPHALARVAARLDIPLLHVSTDYVFDGTRNDRDYVEDDPAHPLNVYGRTKLRGEQLVRGANPKHLIVRTSWVFSAFGANFVKTMLRLGRERSELRIVDDQIGKPTHAGELAQTLLRILETGPSTYGTFNYSGDTAMSWCELARRVFASAARHGLAGPRVEAITTAEYATPAKRPMSSRLDGEKLRKTYGIAPHALDAALDRCIDALLEKP